MAKPSKRMKTIEEKIDKTRQYAIDEALGLERRHQDMGERGIELGWSTSGVAEVDDDRTVFGEDHVVRMQITVDDGGAGIYAEQGFRAKALEIYSAILERNPEWKVSRCEDSGSADSEDDYYARFQVPDDLIW